MRNAMRALAAHRLWWIAFVLSAALFAVLGVLIESPWSWVARAPVIVFGFWIYSAHFREE